MSEMSEITVITEITEEAGLAHPLPDSLDAMVAGANIPLSEQSAWQRWEMASFGDNRPTAVARAEAEKAARAALTRQLSQQISDSRDAARAEGYAAGHQQGHAAGQAEGLAAGREVASAERERLAGLATGLSEALSQADQLIAHDLLSLALDIAKAMLSTAIAARPALLLPLVESLVRELVPAHGPSVLVLHPEDALLVRDHLGDLLDRDGWRLRSDSQMERGGCRIETPTQHIDADISVRWKRIAAVMGKDQRWLDEGDSPDSP